jgi:hypothetical protein
VLQASVYSLVADHLGSAVLNSTSIIVAHRDPCFCHLVNGHLCDIPVVPTFWGFWISDVLSEYVGEIVVESTSTPSEIPYDYDQRQAYIRYYHEWWNTGVSMW